MPPIPYRCTYCLVGACGKCQRNGCACGHVLVPGRKKTMGKARDGRSMEMKFIWSDLPPANRPNKTEERFRPAMEKLRERPGEWAILAEYPSFGGANTASRLLRASGYLDYEYTSRRGNDPEHETSILYVRYNPEAKTKAPPARKQYRRAA